MCCLRNRHSTLVLYANQITDLAPLSGLVHLQRLNLEHNQVIDLSPLQNLPQLASLSLYMNRIEDISSCVSLPGLRSLKVQSNRIRDIASLAYCPSVEDLRLENNVIGDVTGLSNLKKLRRLHLNGNPLDDHAYRVGLDAIAAANPGMTLKYDPCTRPPDQLSVTKGLYTHRIKVSWDTVWNGPRYTSHYRVLRSISREGTKTPVSPWQTDESFDDITAEPGVQYTYWVQTAISPEGDEAGDYSRPDTGRRRLANLPVPFRNILYVDCSASDDSVQTGTAEHAFVSIQQAIGTALEGDCIVVRPGSYSEAIDFLGKNLTVTSRDPCVPGMVSFPVIQGNDQDIAVQFTRGEDPSCTLEGFVISGAHGAILCDLSSPTIAHCLVVGNRPEDPGRAVIACWGSQAWFQHCTIADNMNTALFLHDSDVLITNCILWGNQPEEILLSGTSEPWILYSNTARPWEGPGNMFGDPLFAQPGRWESDAETLWAEGDYHLQSQAGRWDSESSLWLADTVTSPCIDAGDPNTPWTRESVPHGSLANMGAYGNTSQVSRTH